MKRQAGFTLIELVMVIVILGILSAFALPRFADLGQEARGASLQGAFGAIKSASAIAHADALVNNITSGAVSLEGTSINILNGYPDVNATVGTQDIIAAAQISSDDFDLTASTATQAIVRANGAQNAATCQVTYSEAAANGVPAIAIDTDGC